MKITYKKWINILNEKLRSHDQSILVIDYNKETITLSNGRTLQDKEFIYFKKRILNKKTNEWVKNSDRLLNGEITESEIKSILASLGGVACQKKHGVKLRKNLNTGDPWNKGLTGLPGTPHTVETKLKIGSKNKGENNGMYGKKMTADEKAQQSLLMKKLILEGKFTPNSNNRNTHWNAYFCGKKYRSSWEALYQYFDINAKYEELRIEYEFENKKLVYIVDFINHIDKVCIEVKPKELCVGKKFNAKIKALEAWTKDHNYSLLLVHKEWFKHQNSTIDLTLFDFNTQNKIKALIK